MHSHFQLHRRSDGLTYEFDQAAREDGSIGYKRRTRICGSSSGRPWDTPPEAQSDHPPEGDWVSRKGGESYVYELKYLP